MDSPLAGETIWPIGSEGVDGVAEFVEVGVDPPLPESPSQAMIAAARTSTRTPTIN
jgi:hypothetical protein